jgi:hypothetical protein
MAKLELRFPSQTVEEGIETAANIPMDGTRPFPPCRAMWRPRVQPADIEFIN